MRTDLAVILVVIGVTVDVGTSAALLLAVICHETGHLVVSWALGGRSGLLLQVGSGRPYLRGVEGVGPSVAVLIAGGLAAFVPFTASLYMEYFGAKLRTAVLLWTIYQWLPYPSLDGGQVLLRTLFQRVERNLHRWRMLWGVGLLAALGLGLLFPVLVRPLVYFTVMAVLLARGEAGAMRYADAYEAYEDEDHEAVIARAQAVPRYFSEDETEALVLLGLASARAIDDAEAIERLVDALPPHHLERVRAAEYLLRQGHPAGGTLAQLAFEAFDYGRVSRTEIDEEVWADLAFHLASAEAAGGRPDSALALLERAENLGFDHIDRLEADPQLGQLEAEARYQAVVARMQGRATDGSLRPSS